MGQLIYYLGLFPLLKVLVPFLTSWLTFIALSKSEVMDQVMMVTLTRTVPEIGNRGGKMDIK